MLSALVVTGYNSHNDGSPALDSGTSAFNYIMMNGVYSLAVGNGGPLFGGGTNHNGQQFSLAQVNYTNGAAGGAVNSPRFNAAASGSSPSVFPVGPDTVIGMTVAGKGGGDVNLSTSGYVNMSTPLVAGTSGGLGGYFTIKVNGTIVKIPYHSP